MSRHCGICGSQEKQIITKQMFILPKEVPITDQYNIVRCMHCGFLYADTFATQKDYDAYYSLLSKYEDSENVYATLSDTITKEKEYSAALIEGLNLAKDARIIEIGCANGTLLSMLKHRGYSNLYGIDPSKSCVEKVRDIGIQADEGFLTSNPICKNSCELLILEGVLEHVYDLEKTLENLVSYLSVKGKLLIIVPDADDYGANYVAPYYYFDIEHINHFGINDMKNICVKYNLEIVKQSKFEFSFPKNRTVSVFSVVLEKKITKSNQKFTKNDLTLESVNKHIEDSIIGMASYHKIFSQIDEQTPIIVYGAGNHTYRLLANTKLSELNIQMFVDNDRIKQNLSLCERPILPSEMLNGQDAKVIVCTAFSNDVVAAHVMQLGLEFILAE